MLKKIRKKIAKAVDIEETVSEDEPKMHNGMHLLEGDDALLLAEACKLDKSKKAADKRLKEIKIDLDLFLAGDYTNKAGDTVKVSSSAKKSEIDPLELFRLFKGKKIVKRFWSCIKVQLTPLKKVIATTEIEALQTDLDPIIKYSFK